MMLPLKLEDTESKYNHVTCGSEVTRQSDIHIFDFETEEGYTNEGRGSRLLSELCEVADEYDSTITIKMGTRDGLEATQDFLKKHGFSIISISDTAVQAKRQPNI